MKEEPTSTNQAKWKKQYRRKERKMKKVLCSWSRKCGLLSSCNGFGRRDAGEKDLSGDSEPGKPSLSSVAFRFNPMLFFSVLSIERRNLSDQTNTLAKRIRITNCENRIE